MSPVVALYHLFLFSVLPSLIPFLSLVLSFRAINPAKPLTPSLPLPITTEIAGFHLHITGSAVAIAVE